MYWDVKYVKPLPDYRIYVEIEDGRKGIFDVKPYLEKSVFFNELKDICGSIHEEQQAGDSSYQNCTIVLLQVSNTTANRRKAVELSDRGTLKMTKVEVFVIK
mgnify:CR=1 FL=1